MHQEGSLGFVRVGKAKGWDEGRVPVSLCHCTWLTPARRPAGCISMKQKDSRVLAKRTPGTGQKDACLGASPFLWHPSGKKSSRLRVPEVKGS